MKDYRHSPVPTRGGIASIVLVILIAVIVVGPHLLRTSPSTSMSTDPTNGVPTASVASAPPCDGRAPLSMSLRGYLHLAAASVCVASHRQGHLVVDGPSVPLTPAQLHQVDSDFNANSTSSPRVQRTCSASGPSTVVSGVTVDGQEIRLFSDSCTGEFAGAGRYWVPSETTRATMRSVLRR
ncbi:MAG: hypothetical protein QOK30_3344 [Nocardioidaceae bacterium]|jgi:hypothetical protein|nr:hypothetical protein [Nocardioidaceae bacterium]